MALAFSVIMAIIHSATPFLWCAWRGHGSNEVPLLANSILKLAVILSSFIIASEPLDAIAYRFDLRSTDVWVHKLEWYSCPFDFRANELSACALLECTHRT